MIALIDTIFAPVLNWLNQIFNYLTTVNIPTFHALNLGNIFRPLNMISPAWSFLISNVFIMAVAYLIIHVVMSGTGLYSKFKNAVKWW